MKIRLAVFKFFHLNILKIPEKQFHPHPMEPPALGLNS